MGYVRLWEARMGGVVGHGVVKMETTLLNNNKKKQWYIYTM